MRNKALLTASILTAVVACLVFTARAQATLYNFTFSFANDDVHDTPAEGGVSGTVTGLIEGLPADGTNVAAQDIIIETAPGRGHQSNRAIAAASTRMLPHGSGMRILSQYLVGKLLRRIWCLSAAMTLTANSTSIRKTRLTT